MKTIEDIIHELNLKITALNMKTLKIEQENNEIKCSSYLPDFNKGKIEGMREAKKLLEDVKQLDEPQKPVVPKFVGEYLNYCMGNEWTLAEALDTDNVPIPSNMAKTVDWLFSSMNQNIFAQAWLFGYEVEKEPLYIVELPSITPSKLVYDEDYCKYRIVGDYTIGCLRHHLTEKEIKAFDERYWPFAVPVKEVAEG